MANNWTEERFGSLVRFVSDKSQAKDTSIATYVSTENMVADFGGISPAAAIPPTGSVTNFKVGDTLFSNIRTYFKKVWQARFDGRCSNDVLVLRPINEEMLTSDYLHQICRWKKFTELSIRTSKGAKMPRGDKDALADFKFRLPPIDEQRAIAHILGTLDDKIELNRRRNQTLEAMARALFKDWFVDFGPVRARMEARDPYLPADLWQLFPDRLDDTGKPEGWQMVPASDLIEFNPTEPLRKGTPAPYLDMASLPTSGSWPEPPVMRAFGSGMRFRNGDTLLARITPCLENGKTALVQCLPDDTVGWGSTEYIVMRPKAPVPAGYGYLLARDDAFREHAIRSMTGTSGRQRAQDDSVAALKLASPPNKNVWHAFERLVSPTFNSIKVNAKTAETLSELRDTLLPKLISGELRIAEGEQFLARAGALDWLEVKAS